MANDYVVVDVEVDGNDEGRRFKANPYHKHNAMVLLGAMRSNGKVVVGEIPYAGVWVGHNVGFDLNWLRRHYARKHMGKVWDTQLAEYLLTGQRTMMASLDDLAPKYGGKLKDSYVSDAIKSGQKVSSLDQEKLREYWEGDLSNTHKVFSGQIAQAVRLGMLPLLASQMEALRATSDMEYNGMYIDRHKLEEYRSSLKDEVQGRLQRMVELMEDMPAPFVRAYAESPTSADLLGMVLFGGTYEEPIKECVGVFKSGARKGQPKYQNRVKCHEVMPLHGIPLDYMPTGSYDEAALESLRNVCGDRSPAQLFLVTYAEYRIAHKELSTYAEPVMEYALPGVLDASHEGTVNPRDVLILHPNYNHAVTKTGRLSSSGPNMQNWPATPIKKCFISRYGDDGNIVELDFKQLEVVALAVITQCPDLIAALCAGEDIHYNVGRSVFGWRTPLDMDEATRTRVKRIVFGLIYGGGAYTLAQQSGVDVDTVQKVIEAFYNNFPQVKVYHRKITKVVEDCLSLEPTHVTEGGRPARTAMYTSITRRRYAFPQYDKRPSKWDSRLVGLSPTQIKNWPVQGLGTGDMVPEAVGRLSRAVDNLNAGGIDYPTRLIGTIHDSAIMDVHDKYLQRTLTTAREVATSLPKYMEERFSITVPCPVTCSIKVGKNWYDHKKV